MLGLKRPQECRHHSYLSVGLRNVPFSPHLAKESRACSRCPVKAALSQDPPSRCCIFSDETDKQSLYVRFSLSENPPRFRWHRDMALKTDRRTEITSRHVENFDVGDEKACFPCSVPFFENLRCLRCAHHPMGHLHYYRLRASRGLRYSQGGNDRA